MKQRAWILALLGLIAIVLVATIDDRDEPAPSLARAGVGARVGEVERSPLASRPAANLPNPPSSQIRGRLSDPESGPLTEGRVDIYCMESMHQASATIGEEGEFALPACATGPSCLRLTHPGVEQPRAWEVDGPGEVEFEGASAPRVAGTVYGHGPDEVVAGAELILAVEQNTHAQTFAATSDAAGEFAVALPRRRPCDRCDAGADDPDCTVEPDGAATKMQLLASAPGFAATPIELELSGSIAVDVALLPAAPAISGYVLGEDGEPFRSRTRVLATHRARAHERHAAVVDADGQFRFDGLAAAGEYDLRAIRDEREIASLELARTGERVDLRAKLPARGAPLSVEVVDAEQRPVVGARVDGGPFRAATTDAEGRVEADDVLPGSYVLRVRPGDCPAIREAIELQPNAPAWTRRVQLGDDC